MFKKININIIFNFFLFIWILSIPYKNMFYQLSVVSILSIFLYHLVVVKNYGVTRNIFILYKDVFITIMLLMASMLLSTVLNLYSIEQIGTIIKFFFRYVMVFFVLIYFYKNRSFTVNNLIIYSLISFALLTLNGYYQFFFTDMERVDGNVFNSNAFGFLMALASILVVVILFGEKKRDRYSYLFFIILFLFIFLLLNSGSRSSWLMFFGFFGTFFFLNYKNINKGKFLFLFLITFLGILFYFESGLANRLELLLQGDSSHRFEIWQIVFDSIKANPIFGHGIDSLRYLEIIKFVNSNTIVMFVSPHNNVLLLLHSVGIVGFIIFNIILYKVLKEIYRYKSPTLFAVFIAFIVSSNFDHDIFLNKIFISTITIFAFFVFYKRVENIN